MKRVEQQLYSSARHALRYYFLSIMLIALLGSTRVTWADNSPYDWAFIHLDYVRNEKVRQLQNFCDRTHDLAMHAKENITMVEFFDVNLKYFTEAQNNAPPEKVFNIIGELRQAFNDYYISNWLAFYDILFIDKQGRIFYSIRKESDFGRSMFEGDLASTPLARCLSQNPMTEVFIDFHFYDASDEPACFFVEPISKNGEHLGWIVLQVAINKINSLFAGTELLGETGETLVANRHGYMLTESNFEDNSTILKKQLDDRNIEPKFSERQGHRTVTDYRGFKVLTSFEVVEFLGVQWLAVAKVDESQVTTEHFIQHRNYYHEQIIDYLVNSKVAESEAPYPPTNGKIIRRVDMDEFVKASHDELLQTLGVSTCTALVATFPEKFGYLAHISPIDRVYGGNATNLLGHITKKIKTYDIYKYERRRVRFVIIARHLDSLIAIVDKLVGEGFLLSQISVMYHPKAKCARVLYDYSRGYLSVEWIPHQTSDGKCIQHADVAHNLGALVKQSIDRQKEDL